MTTALTKPVRRLCTRIKDGGRNIIVSLEPGDILTFRTVGFKSTYRIALEPLFNRAAADAARNK